MVYELVWKNQCLNCFTHACRSIATHMHKKQTKNKTLMHVNTHPNDNVAVTEKATLLQPHCYLETKLCRLFSQYSSYLFWIIAHVHIHFPMCTYTSQLTDRGINRKQPKQTLDYTSQYNSRESHQSVWHEAWLSWKWGMLSHTLSLVWHHLHQCEPRMDLYLWTWLK